MMEAFILYLLKSCVCLGIFLLIYVLFLRKTTFFRFNRIFLMTGFFVSLIIPSVKYTYDVFIAIPVIPVTDNIATEEQNITASPSMDSWTILFSVYVVGICLFLLRNLYVYGKLSKLLSNGKKEKRQGIKLIDNNKVQSPFTILNYILINLNKLTDIEKDIIIKHETTHITQKHWIDLICGECMLVLQWFNPLIWIYMRLLKENHEFLADKAVIDSGVSPVLYQAVLINQEFQGPVFSFSNSFNYLKPLNRLSMIKKTKSASWKRIAALLVIPAFGLYIWASAEPRYIFEQNDIQELLANFQNVDNNNVKEQEDSTKKSKVFIVKNDKSSGEAKAVSLNGDIISINEEPVTVINVKASTKTDGSDDVVVVGYGKSSSSSSLDLNDLKGNIKSIIVKSDSGRMTVKGKPVIMLDGKIVDIDMKDIRADEIENIQVLKGEKAAIFGKKGEENGVMIIQTKEYLKNNPDMAVKKISISIDSDNNSTSLNVKGVKHQSFKDALILIDGEEVTERNFNLLDKNNIESMSILKDASAIEKYGKKGKNGVIIITTKK